MHGSGPLPQGTTIVYSSWKAKLYCAAMDIIFYGFAAWILMGVSVAVLSLPPVPSAAIWFGLAVWAVARCRRMEVIANDSELVIRNKWRTIMAPWSSVEAVVEASMWWAVAGPIKTWAVQLNGRRYPVLLAGTLLTPFDDPRLRFILAHTGQQPDNIQLRSMVF